ncbi:isoamylase early set domain-containing protein [Hydrogenimonas sp.]|uniref:isoamylase early set domain-containing protein n=1 Tax=Hydrogenimonas sp. TaxID=2231112 RepID=UPI002601ED9C|nr:isoamylase early set domain-containing protein [Hydrogenimonas sp.]
MVKITKKGKKAWVTFTAPTTECDSVAIKGSWNKWEPETMKKKKSGEFYITKVLPVGESFEFGYLVDESDWLADHELPLAETPFGSKNSVLEL